MTTSLEIILERFYKKLHDNTLRQQKKLVSNSVLFTTLKINSNKSAKLFNDSGIIPGSDERHIFRELEESRLIQKSEKIEEYILTALGIWECEKRRGFTEKQLLEYLHNANFNSPALNRALSDKEKITLLALIGTRTFSSTSIMELKKDSYKKNWLEIFASTYNFLLELNVIKLDLKLFETANSEHPIVYLMERVNDLPKKSQQIFIYKGNRQYYLDVYKENKVSTVDLKLLFKLIFNKIPDADFLSKVFKFCENIAYNRSMHIKENWDYIDTETDSIIKQSLNELYLEG